MKYISGRSVMTGRQRVNPALERVGAMIRTISPNRASFGRCSACAVRSLSICGALDQADLAEFERIARQVQFAPNEALFTAGQVASAVHSLTAGVARLYKLLPDGLPSLSIKRFPLTPWDCQPGHPPPIAPLDDGAFPVRALLTGHA